MSAKLLSVENGFQAATSAALPQCDLEADTVEIPIKLCNLPPLKARLQTRFWLYPRTRTWN